MRGWAFPNPTSFHLISLHLPVSVSAVTTDSNLNPNICLCLQILVQLFSTPVVREDLINLSIFPVHNKFGPVCP